MKTQIRNPKSEANPITELRSPNTKPGRCSWAWGAHASRVLPTASRRRPRGPISGSPFGAFVWCNEAGGATPPTTRRRRVLPSSHCIDTGKPPAVEQLWHLSVSQTNWLCFSATVIAGRQMPASACGMGKKLETGVVPVLRWTPSGVHVAPLAGHPAKHKQRHRGHHPHARKRNPNEVRVIGVPEQLRRTGRIEAGDFL